MRKISQQGLHLTANQRARLQRERALFPSQYQAADFQVMKAQLDSRVFVGPPTPMHLRKEAAPDREAERFWRMSREFEQYGRIDCDEHGTPFIGDMVAVQ